MGSVNQTLPNSILFTLESSARAGATRTLKAMVAAVSVVHVMAFSLRSGQGRSRLHDQGWCARQQAPAVVCSTVSRRCSDLDRSRGRRLQFSPSGPARWLATRHRLKQACSGDSNSFRSSTNLPSHWHTCNANGFLKGRCTDDEHQSRLLQAAQRPSRSRSHPSD